jgi:hypothetical protein
VTAPVLVRLIGICRGLALAESSMLESFGNAGADTCAVLKPIRAVKGREV